MSASDLPLSRMMKEGCADLHDKAERGRLPVRMTSGEMTRDEFARMLCQDAIWNKALDAAILEHRDSIPGLKALVEDIQLQGPYYDEDLAHYGASAQAEPTAGVKAMLEAIENARRSAPLALLGLHYVREGANNGNRYVAKKLRAAWGLNGGDGLRTLDPYGKNQRRLWEKFKAALDAQPFTAEEKTLLVQAGRTMFERVMAIHEDLAAATA